uniref:BTB domain-containing protein n=1 Tax=Steinernema glaseri TaxID=37863 RepID=A0A1I7ZDG0_9BILA
MVDDRDVELQDSDSDETVNGDAVASSSKSVAVNDQRRLDGAPISSLSLFNMCANKILFGPDRMQPTAVKPLLPKTIVRRLEYYFEDVEAFTRRRVFATQNDYSDLIREHAVIFDHMEFVCIDSDATVLQLKPYLPPEEYFALCALNGLEDECKIVWDRHLSDPDDADGNANQLVILGSTEIVHDFALHFGGASSLRYSQLAYDAAARGLRVLMLKCLEHVPDDEIGAVIAKCVFGASQAEDDYWDVMDALWCHKHRQKVTLRSFCDMLEDMNTEDTVTSVDDWSQDVICKFLEFSDDTPFAQIATRVFLTWLKEDDAEVLDAKVRRQLKNSNDERDLHDLKMYTYMRTLPPLTEESFAEMLVNTKFNFLQLPGEEKPENQKSDQGEQTDLKPEADDDEDLSSEKSLPIIDEGCLSNTCEHGRCDQVTPSSSDDNYEASDSRGSTSPSSTETAGIFPSGTTRKRSISELADQDAALVLSGSVRRFCAGLDHEQFETFAIELNRLMDRLEDEYSEASVSKKRRSS